MLVETVVVVSFCSQVHDDVNRYVLYMNLDISNGLDSLNFTCDSIIKYNVNSGM